jgi:tRNA (cmo5U34)-methyltransferase
MSDLPSAFSWQDPGLIRQFLANVRGAIPISITQIDMMLRLLTAARERVNRFLDLGCGDGMLASAILAEYPNSRGVLVEESKSLLDSARHRLNLYSERLEFVPLDLNQPGQICELGAAAPFDAVVSAFAIHRANDARKHQIYREIFSVLDPGGIFLNIEHVASATRWTESAWDDYLIEAIFGDAIKRSPGKTRAEAAQDYYEQVGRAGQALAPLEVQCEWLRNIGFENVECYLKVQELAVFGGQRPTAAK